MKLLRKIVLTILMTISVVIIELPVAAATQHFYVLPLGTSGGELADNLSSYLIAAYGSHDFIALDAGTLCSAMHTMPISELQHLKLNPVSQHSLAQTLLTQHVKAYLLSHAHLDHISGLVMCSTIDSHKDIMASDTTINYLRDDIFNWKIWPNFADEGTKPQLKQYHYHRLSPQVSVAIPGVAMTVQALILNHGNGYPASAFLIKSQHYYLLYFGDTGADPIEHSHDIEHIWQLIAPLIRSQQLSAIFIEASYPNTRADRLLFGHLTPHWLLYELTQLANLVNPAHPNIALQGLPIIVTHIKQGLENEAMAPIILKSLNQDNKLGVKFIVPAAGHLMAL